MTYKEEMIQINEKIKFAEEQGKPVSKMLYIKQIELLEKAHTEFIETAAKKGYDLNTNLDILETEIRQFTAMSQLAKKIGISTEKYEKYIKDARIRVYGKECTEQIFYSQNNKL